MYTNWDIGQPNNLDSQMHSNGQDCVEIGNSLVTPKKWNDMDCDTTSKFICEKSTTGNSKTELEVSSVLEKCLEIQFCKKSEI